MTTVDKNIDKMNKGDLITLIKETIENINAINASVWNISDATTKSMESELKINWEEWFLININNASNEIDEKLKSIREAYNEVIWEWEDWTSIKWILDQLIEQFEADKKRIKQFQIKVFWSQTKDEAWKVIVITKWLEKELDEFITNGNKRYESLMTDIETKLLPWATSVELAKAFTTKVDEYKSSTKTWTSWLIWILLVITIYFWIYYFLNPTTPSEYKDVWIWLFYKAPFLLFAVWLIKTVSDRRAESKKLEESYKHKEVMSISYMWYKKAILELESEDTKLMEKHMDNLLNAINNNSSEFLQNSWENHPIISMILTLFWKKKD